MLYKRKISFRSIYPDSADSYNDLKLRCPASRLHCSLHGIRIVSDIQASLSYFFEFWRSEGKILKLLIHDLPGKNREMAENPREKRGEDSLPESFYKLDLSKLDFSKAAIPEADVSAFLHAAEIGPETEKTGGEGEANGKGRTSVSGTESRASSEAPTSSASCRDAADRTRWTVLSDTGRIRPCIGCFCCWLKTPGRCVIRDGFEHMGALLSEADELLIISRCSFGGFSPFVKNVLDRSIGYLLPYFRIIRGEMHHRIRPKRAPLPLRILFYGENITEEEKAEAESYVRSVCINLEAELRELRFYESSYESSKVQAEEKTTEPAEPSEKPIPRDPFGQTSLEGFVPLNGKSREDDPAFDGTRSGRLVLLNGSLRGKRSNTLAFLETIRENTEKEAELYSLSQYMGKQEELLSLLKGADTLILGMPLYVDGIPSAVLRLMEALQASRQDPGRRIYVISNMGFYESRQLKNLLRMVQIWSEKCSYTYCGGLAIGAGEMLGTLIRRIPLCSGPMKHAGKALLLLSERIREGKALEKDLYIGPAFFPRFFYILAAHMNFREEGKKNGLSARDLLAAAKP